MTAKASDLLQKDKPLVTPPAAEKPPEAPALPESLKGKSSEEIDREIAELREKAAKFDVLQAQPPAAAAPPAAAPPPQETWDDLFYRNPQEAVRIAIRAETAPFVESLRSTAFIGKKAAEKKYPEVFKKYGSQVEQLVQSLHPALQIMPDVYQKAARTVWVNNEEDPVPVAGATTSPPAITPPSAKPVVPPTSKVEGSSPPAGPSGTLDISEDEIAAAKDAGMTPEDYVKFRDMQPEE